MTTATLINGKVKYTAGQPKDFGNGPRINIVVDPDSGGESVKVWGKPEDAIASLRKGEAVQLLYDGKNYKLVQTQQAPLTTAAQMQTTQPQPQTPASSEEAYDQLLRNSASRYAKALKLARAIAARELQMTEPDLTSPDGAIIIKEIGMGLFIEANRRSR